MQFHPRADVGYPEGQGEVIANQNVNRDSLSFVQSRLLPFRLKPAPQPGKMVCDGSVCALGNMDAPMEAIHVEEEHSISQSERNHAAISILDGVTIEYTSANGSRNVVEFLGATASYWSTNEANRVSNRNDNIPYRVMEIRPGLIHATLHEKSIGDLLFLVVDLENELVHSTSLAGFPSDDRQLQFEDGTITRTMSNQ